MHDIKPWACLRDLLCLLPRWPKHSILKLAPAYWSVALERPGSAYTSTATVWPCQPAAEASWPGVGSRVCRCHE